MIDWTSIAYRLGYSSETEMWERLYSRTGASMSVLAARFGVTSFSIRRALVACKVPIRHRGRRRQVQPLSPEELKAILAEGISTAAKRRSLTYAGLYRQVKQTLFHLHPHLPTFLAKEKFKMDNGL
jgi:hypothetical protein